MMLRKIFAVKRICHWQTSFGVQRARLSVSAPDPDDEFYFPVMLVGKDSSKFIWESNDITAFCDLNPDLFAPEKELVHSDRAIKVLKATHKSLGTVGFSFVKDPDNMWKICTITVFGDECGSNSIESMGNKVIESFNSMAPGLAIAKPFQFLSPPYCWSIYDDIRSQVKDHEDGCSFVQTEPFSLVLASPNIAQFSFGVGLLDHTGSQKATFSAFATVNNASQDATRQLCSVFLNKC